jgi:hypothetical protein
MTEQEIQQLKDLYIKVLSPEVAKLMCDKLDKMNAEKQTNE